MTITPGTTAFYDDWAVNGQESARSAISNHFASAFAPGARVLDVGCGTGRDLAVLLELGFKLANRAEIATPSTDTRWRVLLFDR